MKPEERAAGNRAEQFFMAVVLLFFLIGGLGMVLIGARIYPEVVSSRARNQNSRAILSYLAVQSRAHDSADSMQIGDGPQGQALIFTEAYTGYELRIYTYQGKLMEEYLLAEKPCAPEEAVVIADCELFKIRQIDAGSIRVMTDEGDVILHHRSDSSYPEKEGGAVR